MDWSTVLVSTSLSAVVGALVSLLAVSQTTTRQRRAERRDDGRQRLKAVVAPRQVAVKKYQSKLLSSLKREEQVIHGDDYSFASEVLAAAEELSSWRRWLVNRRARRVIGAFIVDTAAVSPGEGDSWGGVAVLLIRQYTSHDLSEPARRIGLYHHALMTDPGSTELKRLEKELRRLAAGR
jgi:hypothetical protein